MIMYIEYYKKNYVVKLNYLAKRIILYLTTLKSVVKMAFYGISMHKIMLRFLITLHTYQ